MLCVTSQMHPSLVYLTATTPNSEPSPLAREGEERHELWGQPGKFKVTAYFVRGLMGDYKQAIELYDANPNPVGTYDTAADYYMNATRRYVTAPGLNFNME